MENEKLYSDVRIETLKPFRMARYVIISPNPEDDVINYMKNWAQRAGLLKAYPDAMQIGWDFPTPQSELVRKYNLRGYVAAYILPDGFPTDCPGVEYFEQAQADYGVLTIYDPFVAPFERIPGGYKKLLSQFREKGLAEGSADNIQPCFERVYEKDGVTCMDIYIHVTAEPAKT